MNNILKIFVCLSFISLAFIICNYIVTHNNKDITNENVQIHKTNDSLKLDINNLDSIKNARVIEVQKIDGDSTIKLFYELIE